METSTTTPKRYHPLLVTLHWLTLILLFAANAFSEGEGRRSTIDIHMILGVVLLVVIVTRLIVRLTTKRPAWADTGNKYLNMLGEFVHWAMYLVIFLILGMGGYMAFSRNLIGSLLGSGAVLRAPRIISAVHHLSWFLIVLLLFAHIAGALYHQFIIKDNLLSRMWFGKR